MPKTDLETPLLEPAPSQTVLPSKRGIGRFFGRLGGWIASHKLIFSGIVTAVLIMVAGVVCTTNLKYPVLGLVFKASTAVTVLDSKTGQPLPSATVSLAGHSAITDNAGHAELKGLPLGPTTLEVTKEAYKYYSRAETLFIRQKPLTPVKLESAGIMLSFNVSDKISGHMLDGAEIDVGNSKAITGAQGEAALSLLPRADVKAQATVKKTGFLDLVVSITVRPNTPAYSVTLTPAGKVYYLSNRSGRIDLYESNLDHSDETVVLAGTGNEDSETGILPNIGDTRWLAIVSSREGRRDGGALLHDLYMFDTTGHTLTKISNNIGFGSKRVWLGDTLVFESYDPANCASLKAYNPANAQLTTFVTGGGSNGCVSLSLALKDKLLYSITGAANSSTNGLYLVQSNGQGRRQLDPAPASNIDRQQKNTALYEYYDYSQPYQTQTVWKSLDLVTFKVTGIPNGPSVDSSRAYVDSPGGKFSTFIETRDGKSELYLTAIDGTNEQKLTNLGAVNQFVQWYGDSYIVFSLTKSDENALYIVSTTGGSAQKVTDFYQGNSRTYGGGYNPVY